MTGRNLTLIGLLISGAALLAPGAAAEDDSARLRHGGARRAIDHQTTALAALEPVGSVDGWGRVTVQDVALADGTLRRVLTVHLLGLDAEADYSVVLDGVTVAELITDPQGDARTRLQSPADGAPSPFDGLPPADTLLEALVLDASEAVALEGAFVARSFGFAGPADLVYSDRVRLEPTGDWAIRGIARVTCDGDDVQTFESRACGLAAGTIYTVRVDGIDAGLVTADGVGQAAIELTTATDDNPLPGALQPIEELRLVEWSDAGGTVVLAGSFDGTNMVGEGPLRDRMGDGSGRYGPADDPGDGNGNGTGGDDDQGQGGDPHAGDAPDGGPHGSNGDCDGEGDGNGAGQGNGAGNGN